MTFSDLKIAVKIFFSYRVRKKAIKIAIKELKKATISVIKNIGPDIVKK